MTKDVLQELRNWLEDPDGMDDLNTPVKMVEMAIEELELTVLKIEGLHRTLNLERSELIAELQKQWKRAHYALCETSDNEGNCDNDPCGWPRPKWLV